MKQQHERFMTFKAYRESNPGELAKISSINSINLSLLHQFQLALTVSAVSGRELLQVPSLGEKFWEWNFFFFFSLSVYYSSTHVIVKWFMKPPVPRLRYCHLNNEYSATCSNPPAAIPRNRTKSDRALLLSPSLFKTNNADSWKTHSNCCHSSRTAR